MFFAAFMLAGCLSLTPRPYDNVEYGIASSLTVNTTRAIYRCSEVNTSDSKELWKYIQNSNTDSLLLYEYITNKDNSDMLVPAIVNVRDLMNDVLKNSSFSSKYCIHKLSNIQVGSRILSRTLGQSDNFNVCQGDVSERFKLFKDSYDKKLITVAEYKELVEDLINLKKINTAGCDQATRTKMLEDLQMLEKILPTILGL